MRAFLAGLLVSLFGGLVVIALVLAAAAAAWLSTQPSPEAGAANALDFWVNRYEFLIAGALVLSGIVLVAITTGVSLRSLRKELGLASDRFRLDAFQRLRSNLLEIEISFAQLLVALEIIQEDIEREIESKVDDILFRLRNSSDYQRSKKYLEHRERVDLEALLWRLERRHLPGVPPVFVDEIKRIRENIYQTGFERARDEARKHAEILGFELDRPPASPSANDGPALDSHS